MNFDRGSQRLVRRAYYEAMTSHFGQMYVPVLGSRRFCYSFCTRVSCMETTRLRDWQMLRLVLAGPKLEILEPYRKLKQLADLLWF